LKTDILLYAASTAFNKGAVLLFFPLLTQFLSLPDFGIWSLVIVISNLLVPIVMLNGSAAILREGSEDQVKGAKILQNFVIITILLSGGAYFTGKALSLDDWFLYAIAISSAEAVSQLALTFIRVQEKVKLYFLLNLLKMLSLLGLIIYAKKMEFDLYLLLYYHFYIVIIFATISIILQYKNYTSINIDFNPVLLFSLALIPHGASQWIMSSSDRLILKYVLGVDSVGVYSLAYNIALILALLNSGLSMALPTYMIKNYNKWKESDFDNKFISYYTYVSILTLIPIVSLYIIDFKFFGFLGYYENEMLPLIFVLYFSIYILGLYCFFANYLFYHKKAGIISKITFSAAFLNIFFTFFLIKYFGVIGAALGTFFAYIYYLLMTRHQAEKIDRSISISLTKPIIVFSFFLCLIYIGADNAM